MQEFMLLVRTTGDHLEKLSADEQQGHIERITQYIENMALRNQLKGAQPLDMDGVLVSKEDGTFKDGPFNETREVIVGYFLIQAPSLEMAVEIAKANPVFEDTSARIEIRPIKRMEGIN